MIINGGGNEGGGGEWSSTGGGGFGEIGGGGDGGGGMIMSGAVPMTLFLAFTLLRLPLTLRFRLIPLSRRRRGI